MKSKRLKYAIWGGVIFGGLHLVVFIYLFIKGGDAALILYITDHPLCFLGEKYFSHLYYNNYVFFFTWFGFLGTLIYFVLGCALGFIINKLRK